MRIGLDVGSTTLKCVVLDKDSKLKYSAYERHFSQIRERAAAMLLDISRKFPEEIVPSICVSGSAGMGLAEQLGLAFEQEVYATSTAVKRLMPATDAVVELGGEDAKILFLTGMTEVRMNGSCAGGTGAFIDQMASLLNVEPSEMNKLAARAEQIYPIASRCGVFAKSDIQPLLNQGARREDVAASIFGAVVQQTISGLSQGRRIEGNVLYLGGPLTYFEQLRYQFDQSLKLKGTCPEHSLLYVAIGAALSQSATRMPLMEIISKIETNDGGHPYKSCDPLFASQAEYDLFCQRHKRSGARPTSTQENPKRGWIGVDAGSTTVKAVAIDENGDILMSSYQPNSGNPIPLVQEFLLDFYQKYPDTQIVSTASTGYGEELIKSAFMMDGSLVETMAHYLAAQRFEPAVDFIIDIGGQDIKCFKIRNGTIDNIFLNEACSSGCGSFLQTFAGAMNVPIEEFARLGLFAEKPVDLGSRCTVFMNSSVKQAQKDGASIESISAGLSISVVKNALYKVIRSSSADGLGKKIVVQGGTFLNDAVLRAFEAEIGEEVVRPAVAELMGAYGAALYAKNNLSKQKSTVLDSAQLATFQHTVKDAVCKGCTNRCRLTINTFPGGRRLISGNRCEKGLGVKNVKKTFNMVAYKRELLSQYQSSQAPSDPANSLGTIGIPLGLNNYELLPFWHAFFTKLGFNIITSPASTHELYLEGQHTIPSDTVCYPAKLMHGHIEYLINKKVDMIFYPCMSYNLDEGLGDNHYNCPVVAYYPEVIAANVADFQNVKFINDYVGIHRPKDFPKKMGEIFARHGIQLKPKQLAQAANAAYKELTLFRQRITEKGQEYMKMAEAENLPVIILAGRPYHMDPEINHGIDQLICSCGAVLVTEDAISPLIEKFGTAVLNQWTYHSRMYAAAKYVAMSGQKRINLVQLVSFGCGVDAITTDEMRKILEYAGRIYTQIKIDEISNLGAARIRLRSLFTALEM